MAAPLKPAQKAEYGPFAWGLSLRGLPAQRIAESIERRFGQAISEKAVDRLLATQEALAEKQFERRRRRAAARFVAEQEAIYAKAWVDIDVKPGMHRVAMECSRLIADVYGVFTQHIDITSQGERCLDMSGFSDDELRSIIARAGGAGG